MNRNQDTAAVSLIPWQQAPPVLYLYPWESTSRSSTEHGLSSPPSLEMVRKAVGDTDWGRLLSLLPARPRRGRLGVGAACAAALHRKGGAHGGRRECLGAVTEMFQMYVFWSLIFEIPLERHPRFNLPLLLQKTQKSETLSLSGLTVEGETPVCWLWGQPFLSRRPPSPAAGHGAAKPRPLNSQGSGT